MTKFVYKAKSDPVQVIEGAIDAGSEEEAVNKLSLIGYFPFSVTSEGISAKEGIFHKKISGKDILNFTQQLSNLLESRINIIKAFYIISGQTHNRNLKILVEELLQKIKQGSSFSESLSSYPRLFSSFYVSMIRTGEASGRLEETLNKLALFLNKKQDFKRSLIEAMIYPAFVILVSIVTVFTLLTFVTPRILGLFSELNQNLPLPTKILIFISNAAINYWWLLASVLISFALVFKRIYGQEKEKIRLDQLFLKAPVIGSMIFKQQAARVMNTLSILISSGLPLLESLNISISSLQNAYLKNEFSKYKKEIANGASLSKCLEKSKILSPFITSIIVIGEETGTLEKSLGRIGLKFEIEVEAALKTFSKMLEPVIILVMGIIVGFIVLSILLPIFEINAFVS